MKLDIRQAIVTKYIVPTDTKGSRVKASCAAGSLTIGWQSDLNSDENHEEAARQLSEKFGWHVHNDYVAGGLKDGTIVFVAVPKGKLK